MSGNVIFSDTTPINFENTSFSINDLFETPEAAHFYNTSKIQMRRARIVLFLRYIYILFAITNSKFDFRPVGKVDIIETSVQLTFV